MGTSKIKSKKKKESTRSIRTGTYNNDQITSIRCAAMKVATNASMGKIHAMIEKGETGSSPLTGSTCFGAIVEADSSTVDNKSKKKKNLQQKSYQTASEESLFDATARGSLRGSEEAVDLTPSALQEEEKSVADMDLTSLGHASTISTTSKFSKKMKRVFPKGSIIKLKLKRRRSSRSGKLSLNPSKRLKKSSRTNAAGSHDDEDDAGTVITKTQEVTENAWMCGLCGLAFSGQRLAEVHEFNCVRETFYKTADKTKEEEEEEKKEEEARATSSQVLAYFNGVDTDNSDADKAASSDDKKFNPSLEPIGETTVDNESSKKQGTEAAAPQSKNESTPPSTDSEDVSALAAPTKKITQPNLGLISLSNAMRQYILMTDESLQKVSSRAELYILTKTEHDAERELALLSRDRAYYDMLNQKAGERAMTKNNPLHTSGKGVLSDIRNKFAEAYDLIKENDDGSSKDGKKDSGKGESGGKDINHNDGTLYINVVIMNSASVVNNEMKRLANQRWDTVKHDAAVADAKDDKEKSGEEDEKNTEKKKVSDFEKFRLKAQRQIVRIASLALSSDFTPKRVAVQLSNDLVWLLEPQLQLRGVSIETQIEYRVGPYFVLGVNVKSINWVNLIEHSHKQIVDRRRAYEKEMESIKMKSKRLTSRMSLRMSEGGGENEGEGDKEKEKRMGPKEKCKDMIRRIKSTTVSDIVATVLASMYYINWIVVIPICSVCYKFGARPIVDKYILNSVTNDIFRYVEQKGMEMELVIVRSKDQASFMLTALREMRADDRKHKKKQEESESAEGEETKELLGPLLGPDIKEDAGPAKEPPSFVPPESLEHVGLEIELPVGFRRLRWAFLSSQSEFTPRAVFEAELGYTENVFGEWSAHNEHIGAPTAPDGVNDVDFIGVEKNNSYLMPKSAFVKANTAHETMQIIEYNDFCFSIKYKTLTPEVPYGNTFIAWTQITVTDKGNNTCQMVCSTEAEFPNGPPMVARQIKSGMRAGTAEKFVATGETVIRYADSYP